MGGCYRSAVVFLLGLENEGYFYVGGVRFRVSLNIKISGMYLTKPIKYMSYVLVAIGSFL